MTNPNFINQLDENVQYAKATGQMVKEQGADLRGLLEENIRLNQAIYIDTQKIRRAMFWRMMLSVVGLILVIAPIIIALFYLPPVLMNIYGGYQDVLGESQGTFDLLNQLKQSQ